MSKAILIIDMPATCGDCPLCYKEEMYTYRCQVNEEQVPFSEKPSWCPLKPLIEEPSADVIINKEPTIDAVHSRAGNWLLPKGLFDEIYESEEE